MMWRSEPAASSPDMNQGTGLASSLLPHEIAFEAVEGAVSFPVALWFVVLSPASGRPFFAGLQLGGSLGVASSLTLAGGLLSLAGGVFLFISVVVAGVRGDEVSP